MSYRFFQNSKCEYFPCHYTECHEKFSCLFCFCPLFMTEDCGGAFQLLDGKIKDCSMCLIPHENYDYIIDKLKEIL